MDLQRLIYAIVKKSWLIVLFALIGGGLSIYISLFLTKPMYQAETTLYILNRSNSNNSVLSGNAINLQDITISRQLISDYGNIILTRKVLEPVLNELNNNEITFDGISNAISVNLKKDSNVVSIAVTWPDPEQAAKIANAVSRSFTNQISKLMGTNSIGTLDEAKIPEFPLPSNRAKKAMVGLLAGIMAALGVIYLRALFDNTIYSPSDIEKGVELKVIGVIPEHNI